MTTQDKINRTVIAVKSQVGHWLARPAKPARKAAWTVIYDPTGVFVGNVRTLDSWIKQFGNQGYNGAILRCRDSGAYVEFRAGQFVLIDPPRPPEAETRPGSVLATWESRGTRLTAKKI